MRSPRVLIAFASRFGSTREIASVIGAVLEMRGFWVDVLPVDDIERLEGYDAVLIGSAVREQHWLPEAILFVQSHREALSHVPVVYFAVGMTMADPTPERFHEEYAYLDQVQAIVKPLEIGLFAGSLEMNQLNREQKFKVLIKGLPRGDFRQWHDIRGWAEQIADSLLLEMARKS